MRHYIAVLHGQLNSPPPEIVLLPLVVIQVLGTVLNVMPESCVNEPPLVEAPDSSEVGKDPDV